MSALARLWRGELPLPVAFWGWAVFGGMLVNVATSIACVVLIVADRPIEALLAGYLPSIPYNILVTVAVWRAAGRYRGEKIWADAARIATLAAMTLLSLT